MKNTLILHCWYGEATGDWYPWLKSELEKKGYEVTLPDFPEMRKDQPDMEVVLSEILEKYPPNEETVVIGHSLGTLVAMRLAERVSFKKLILVAGWDFDDLTEGHKLFWKSKIDHAKIKEHVKEIVVVHGEHDPYITPFQAQDVANRFGATFLMLPGKGHLVKGKEGVTEVPELLEFF